MLLTSRESCELTQEPVSLAFMDRTILVIFEKEGPSHRCSCFNNIYHAFDPNCRSCGGKGKTVPQREGKLDRAVIESAGGMADEGDPIAYAYTYRPDVELDSILVCKGHRYRVIELMKTVTMAGKAVTVCGLDYERDYSHDKAVLERYK
jgi:hypothetical protein